MGRHTVMLPGLMGCGTLIQQQIAGLRRFTRAKVPPILTRDVKDMPSGGLEVFKRVNLIFDDSC